jgi:hypothetical protein
MNVKIVHRPVGEAPEWVRDAWVGLVLPVRSKKRRNWRALGVMSGSQNALVQLWAILKGQSFKLSGYAVNASAAVKILETVRPDAAAWWREHTPKMLNGRRYFIFDAPACEVE